ncbi:CLIP-associated protein [Dendrobium catenatum]|uniref:CLIP-associated protein n=1 Tax=Dendrobium catenatum TaxID=906689 RepID=A0A2I0X5N0_9ASPA|nr:CLIP-associated protein [Dendrobium catenatum]
MTREGCYRREKSIQMGNNHVIYAIGERDEAKQWLMCVCVIHVKEREEGRFGCLHVQEKLDRLCAVQEMYTQVGPQFLEELNRHQLPSSMMKDISARLARIEPKVHQSDGAGAHFISTEIKSSNVSHKKGSPRTKSTPRETSLFGGEADGTEKPVEPIKVYSEKELIREFEKIASTLVPEKDWSLRISAMQRIEGLIYGGAADYPSFHMLLKQLVSPLSTQLLDRRSSIVKQACHLLCFLSKELLSEFEAHAEMFIPVLFKLVVITVLVIAESADNCIKTMFRNCKVARVLPRLVESAKNDRNAVLRARCCEYALLILEYWADAPELQRSAELYEDLIKCCVADAMSEVRSTARTCYKMFSKTWPERSRRLFLSFDPAIQRLINDEDGGIHKRYASPLLRDRGLQPSRVPSHAVTVNVPGFSTSAIVAMDRSSSVTSGMSLSTGTHALSQMKLREKGSERSLESMLQASKQKVSAIESLLRGVSLSDKQRNSSTHSTSLDLVQGLIPHLLVIHQSQQLFLVQIIVSLQDSVLADPTFVSIARSSTRNGSSSLTEVINSNNQYVGGHSKYDNLASDSLSSFSLPYMVKRHAERPLDGSTVERNIDLSFKKLSNMHLDRQFMDAANKDAGFRDLNNNYVPNFQRPLLRKQATGRVSASRRRSFDDNQSHLGELSSYVDGPTSLGDALSEGLCSSSDWVARVSAFNYLRNLLQQGPRALSTLAEIIPQCRKPFESYLERILPYVFSRLIDPKELVRQPCMTNLEIVNRTYGIDSLLPALLRSLDEQRSPIAKLAVVEFANNSFDNHSPNPDGYSNGGILKLWLAKLAPLVTDKNTKLKEASISGIISVYTHDSAAVLNFILSLSIEEQNLLRRALKQFTPRIEVDLVNVLQSKKERQCSKAVYDPADVIGTSSDYGYNGLSKKSQLLGKYSGGLLDVDGGKKWDSMQESILVDALIAKTTSDDSRQIYHNLETGSDNESSMGNQQLDITQMIGSDGSKDIGSTFGGERLHDIELFHEKATSSINAEAESELSIPQILHHICSISGEKSSISKHEALQKLVGASIANDNSIWAKYFNQILTAVFDVLDDHNSSTRELALSLILEMLNHQKEAMEDSVEVVIEKLLNVANDSVAKVSNEAHQCLTIVLTKYDTFRCLSVIVPLLASDDENMLVTCINCLTKLVSRLSQEELLSQLPLFLPSIFDAFGSQSLDVRKGVVFCLVDIYILLGKSFLPYLEGLSSTQLRLFTIYANRISQARSIATGEAKHG